MQWSETEPELILTAGRDNKVVCWNYTQDDAPIFSQDVNQPIYDLKWSKKLKSIYSLGLEDKIQIYTMNNNALFNYVPKWYRVPIESAFLGNESIITYS
jgi:WD40 repeat protein